MIKQLLSRLLREAADKIDAGTCEMSEAEMTDLITMIAHEPISKDQACSMLNISRATFDNHVRDGFIPPGRKRKGFKEKVWYKDELEVVMNSTPK